MNLLEWNKIYSFQKVKEIANEAYQEPEPGQQKDAKQTAAVDLISRLNNFRSNSDASSLKGISLSLVCIYICMYVYARAHYIYI